MSTQTITGFGFERPHEGGTNDWLTPPQLVKMLGVFDLDPCGCVGMPWKLATEVYEPPQDGLTLPWHGRVFCNPPYGPHITKWAKRMHEHRNGIFLIFSRTETEAWRYIWQTGDAYLFPYGRTCFYLPSGTRAKSGTAPSCLIAYGEKNCEALKSAGIAGAFMSRAEVLNGVKISSL